LRAGVADQRATDRWAIPRSRQVGFQHSLDDRRIFAAGTLYPSLTSQTNPKMSDSRTMPELMCLSAEIGAPERLAFSVHDRSSPPEREALLVEFLRPVDYQGKVGRVLKRRLHHEQAIAVGAGLEQAGLS